VVQLSALLWDDVRILEGSSSVLTNPPAQQVEEQENDGAKAAPTNYEPSTAEAAKAAKAAEPAASAASKILHFAAVERRPGVEHFGT
jgi:hypothetical protein